MAIPKATLYREFSLSNSSAIPLYQGSAGPEAIKVSSYMQGLYDENSQAGTDLGATADNVSSMEIDRPHADALRNQVQGEIGSMAKMNNWEEQGLKVRSLARNYASRAAELYAPVQQYQSWKKTLDDKEKNLTTTQKSALEQIALSRYRGVSKDGSGKFRGSFDGVGVAKNVDVNEWVDKRLKDIAIQAGGSEIANINGMWKIKKGNEWKAVEAGTIEKTLSHAIQNDMELQDHLRQEGDITGFQAQNNITDVNQLSPVAKQTVMDLVKKGYSPKEAVGMVFSNDRKRQVIDNALQYGKTKYTMHQSKSTYDISENGNFWKQQEAAEKEKANLGIFGDLVTDVGNPINEQFGTPGDIETAQVNATKALGVAQTDLKAARQTVAAALKIPEGNLTDTQIEQYYATNDRAGLGKYKAIVAAIDASNNTIAKYGQVRDKAMDLATRNKFPGKSFESLKTEATTEFRDLIKGGAKIKDDDGKIITNAEDYVVIDGASNTFGGNYTDIRNTKTGVVTRLQHNGTGPAYGADNPKMAKLAGKFSGIDWKSTYKEAALGINSNTMVMPLLNKTTPDGQTTKAGAYAMRIKSALSAGTGGLKVSDMMGADLGSGDTKSMRARIASGNFEVNGVTKRADGKLYVKVSVLKDASADDPADKYQEVLVAADTNLANKMSQYAIEAGNRDKDIRTIQFGMAMRPGSGYEQVISGGTNGNLVVGNGRAFGNKPLYEIVPNITGDASNAVSYEVYQIGANNSRTKAKAADGSDLSFTDAFDLGAYLDTLKSEGKSVSKSNE